MQPRPRRLVPRRAREAGSGTALLAATGRTLPDFVLADTVPKPSSLALLGAGVLGLALLSRFRGGNQGLSFQEKS